jgi:hypothetical protein
VGVPDLILALQYQALGILVGIIWVKKVSALLIKRIILLTFEFLLLGIPMLRRRERF